MRESMACAPDIDPNLQALADVLVGMLVRRFLSDAEEEPESDSDDEDKTE